MGLSFNAVKSGGFFIFIFFIFVFIKIYFRFRNLQKYTPAVRGWAAGTWSPRCGAAGAFVQKLLRKYLRADPWGSVAQQRGGRP